MISLLLEMMDEFYSISNLLCSKKNNAVKQAVSRYNYIKGLYKNIYLSSALQLDYKCLVFLVSRKNLTLHICYTTYLAF